MGFAYVTTEVTMLVFHGAAGKAPPTSNIAGGFKPWARMPHCRSPLREVRATNIWSDG
jgi:hypothetical protein